MDTCDPWSNFPDGCCFFRDTMLDSRQRVPKCASLGNKMHPHYGYVRPSRDSLSYLGWYKVLRKATTDVGLQRKKFKQFEFWR